MNFVERIHVVVVNEAWGWNFRGFIYIIYIIFYNNKLYNGPTKSM